MKKLLIITGGNKGIGKGIVKAYKQAGYKIISIARTKNQETFYADLNQIEFDLNLTEQVSTVIEKIFSELNFSDLDSITLLNNSGTLGEITTLENKSTEDIEQSFKLNTIAPFILTSSFIKLTENFTGRKKIINISSGASTNAYFGWSTYSASKAAIDMLTKSVAVEQADEKYPVNIIAISPGVVDTDMQAKIRQSDEKDFKDVAKFIDYKNNGGLASAEQVGEEIYFIDHSEKYKTGTHANVRDLR
jgi:benzil reductase ((S)-benzoin forming)